MVNTYQKQLEKRLFFRFLLKANKSGVYALVNEKQKKILVQSASHVMKHLGNNVALLSKKIHPNKQLKKDRRYLSIKLLEQCDSAYKEVCKLKWIEHYRNLGYIIYNTEKLPVYTVRKTIVYANTSSFRMQVQLVSKGKRVVPVKNFLTDTEASEFIKTTTVYDLLLMSKKYEV